MRESLIYFLFLLKHGYVEQYRFENNDDVF
jgi:hypothetical protein